MMWQTVRLISRVPHVDLIGFRGVKRVKPSVGHTGTSDDNQCDGRGNHEEGSKDGSNDNRGNIH